MGFEDARAARRSLRGCGFVALPGPALLLMVHNRLGGGVKRRPVHPPCTPALVFTFVLA
jgi:hypothetical protein